MMLGVRGLGDYDYTLTMSANVLANCRTAGCSYDLPFGMSCSNDVGFRDLAQYGYVCTQVQDADGNWISRYGLDPSRSTVYSGGTQVTSPPQTFVLQYLQSLCPDGSPWNCNADVNLPQVGACPPVPGFQVRQTGSNSCHYYKHSIAELLSGCQNYCAVPKPCDGPGAAALGFEISSMDGNSPVGGGNCWYHKLGTPLPVTSTTLPGNEAPIPGSGPIPRAPSMLDTFGLGSDASGDLIPGISNQTLLLAGGGLLALLVLGGRR